MKINKSPKLVEYINRLSEINDLNLSLSDMFLSIISNFDITSPKEIDILTKTYNKDSKDLYFDKIVDYWDIDEEVEDNKYILDNYIYPSINKLSIEQYLDNPYYKNIKISNQKIGQYELVNDKYRPYELFPSDDIKVDDDYIEHSEIGYFEKEFSFIAINQNKITWMSVNPNEIKTMQKHIDRAKGNVIVFGLGLGYYPYMISLKEEVTSITIIERDNNIIKLFKENILNQFPNKDKIHIVQDDALDVIKKPLNYDFTFVDLWHNAEDGFNLFINFKKQEHISPNTVFSYWLDNSFYALLRRAFIALLIENLEGYNDSNYQHADTTFDSIVNHLYFQTKNLQINSEEEIKSLLTNEALLRLYL